MRNVLLTLCLSAVTAAFAQNAANRNDFSKVGVRLHYPVLKEVRMQSNGKPFAVQPSVELKKAGVKEIMSGKKILTPQEYMRLAEASKTERLDSIIGYLNSGKDKYMRQYFIFDANNNPVKRINSYWNGTTGKWDDAEYYEYILDEDGYVLSQMAYSETAGQRYDYEYEGEYNGIKLGVSMTLSEYNGKEWIPLQRGEYVYDDKGNIIQEVLSAWNSVNSSWDKVVKNVAGYNDKGQQVLLEPYVWTGSAWIGEGEKKTYEWTEDGTNHTLVGSWIWDTHTMGWFLYCKDEKDFNEFGLCTRAEKMFYNRDLDNWDGGYSWDGERKYNNSITLFEYDELGRLIYEKAAINKVDGAYVFDADATYVWSDLENGVTQCDIVRRLGKLGTEEVYVNHTSVERYDAGGHMIYQLSKHINISTGELQNDMKIEREYDADGNILKSFTWGAKDGVFVAGVGSEYKYNSKNKCIEHQSYRGDAATEDGFNRNNHTFNTYESDTILVDQKVYKWDGSEDVPFYGTGIKYDFSVPVEELVLWPGGDFYHKLVEQLSYNGVPGGWDYMNNVYYYSALNTSSVESATSYNDKGVLVQYADNMLRITADGDVNVNVYGVSGIRVLATTDKTINLSEMPAGIYIVEVNGTKAKIMKK